jgi:co-chaperonin GroES (HSP10)
MRPVNKYILVEPIAEERKGSVYIPISNSLPYKKGSVISVSDIVKQTKAGDIVTYFRRGIACEKIDVEGKFYDLVSEDSLMYINNG